VDPLESQRKRRLFIEPAYGAQPIGVVGLADELRAGPGQAEPLVITGAVNGIPDVQDFARFQEPVNAPILRILGQNRGYFEGF